jgi:type IV fimbrial biogenesis protein FimT
MAAKKKSVSKSGFSLMELMVVISIIGVILSIAFPYISASLPDYRLRSAARDIVSLMMETKLKAVKENANTAISFDFVNDTYTAWIDNGTGGGAGNFIYEPLQGESIFEQAALPNGIDLYQDASSNIANPFAYNNRGFPASNIGSIFLQNIKSNYRKIIVNLSGNIRVAKSSDGTTWN